MLAGGGVEGDMEGHAENLGILESAHGNTSLNLMSRSSDARSILTNPILLSETTGPICGEGDQLPKTSEFTLTDKTNMPTNSLSTTAAKKKNKKTTKKNSRNSKNSVSPIKVFPNAVNNLSATF